MMMVIRSTNRRSGETIRGKLTLVDLAGSERVDKSGAEGQRLKEAAVRVTKPCRPFRQASRCLSNAFPVFSLPSSLDLCSHSLISILVYQQKPQCNRRCGIGADE